MNSDPFAIRAMLDDERRRAWLRCFGINPALDMADITLKEVGTNHAVHCRPVRAKIRDKSQPFNSLFSSGFWVVVPFRIYGH